MLPRTAIERWTSLLIQKKLNKKAPPEGEAGGRGEIRTLGRLLYKAFLVPHHRPLGHSSINSFMTYLGHCARIALLGAAYPIRTDDLLITKQLLYQLS